MQNRTTIKDLILFFKKAELPSPPLKISVCETIINPEGFVKSHIEILEANRGNRLFLPYYERLLKFKQIIEKL